MTGLLADYLTITAGNRPPTPYDQYERYILMCPDDDAGEWFIYGSADGIFDEVQGPFSTRAGVIHFARHALWRICPREIAIVE